MRLPAALLLCAGLLPALVSAGHLVRGAEILLFYNAYRLDVEVSTALAIERGEDPDRSWTMAKDAFNSRFDWCIECEPDTSKRGANFNAFTMGTQGGMGYARKHGVEALKDNPWNPTFDNVRGIAKWPPITGKQYSYGGFNPSTMLGDLAGRQPGNVPGRDGTFTKNSFFDFDNMLAIIGKHCEDLARQKPNIARPYMQKMAELAEIASEGRKIESAGFKIDAIKKALTEKNKAFDKKNPMSITGAVKTKKMSSANFEGTFEDFSVRRTRPEIVKVAGKNAKVFQDELTRLANAYKKAGSAATMEEIKAVKGLDSSTNDHIRVQVQLKRLADSINLQLGGKLAGSCNYPDVFTPAT